METKEMTAEFTANAKANIGRLAELFKCYDAAKSHYNAQRQREKECYDKALNMAEFCASEDCERASIKKGDRITDQNYIFLLSKADFNRLLELAAPILRRAGITDGRGYYITNWLMFQGDARRELVNFIIDELLPEPMKSQFDAVRFNIVQTDKLLDIVRPIVAA